jgi:hypothetical protein
VALSKGIRPRAIAGTTANPEQIHRPAASCLAQRRRPTVSKRSGITPAPGAQSRFAPCNPCESIGMPSMGENSAKRSVHRDRKCESVRSLDALGLYSVGRRCSPHKSTSSRKTTKNSINFSRAGRECSLFESITYNNRESRPKPECPSESVKRGLGPKHKISFLLISTHINPSSLDTVACDVFRRKTRLSEVRKSRNLTLLPRPPGSRRIFSAARR